MTDVDFDDDAPLDADDRLSVLEAGIRQQHALNERIVRISLPEKIAWEFDVRIPNDGAFLASIPTRAKKRAKAAGAAEGTVAGAMILARYTVGILHGGDYAVDCRDEGTSAFADRALLDRLDARDAVDAVIRLLGTDGIVAGLGDLVVSEVAVDDAEVETIEDPTARA